MTNTTDPRALVERLTGYTPGPWHIEDCETYLDRGMTFYQEVWSDDLDVLVAAEVTRAHNDGGRANMRLIAAAPELLETLTAALDENYRLKSLLGEMVDLMEGVRSGDYVPDSFTCQPARAALKKGTDQ